MKPDLSHLNINASKIHHNLSYEELMQKEEENKETFKTANGTMTVDTGKFTGRSPKDKFFVEEPSSKDNLWWGDVNAKISEDVFIELQEKVEKHLCNKELYVTDGFCGANDNTRMKVRIVSELAWQSHFCKNMFIRPKEEELDDFAPDFTILNACKVTDEKWEEHGLNSEVFVIFDISKKLAIIGGTFYGGEMKKGIFSIMNYYLPLKGILAMHCSANKGQNGDTALFFGLSGTGKTTLSTDPQRALIGDDEHGWDDEGIFNFEGGCYAKTINLDPKTEPEIFDAIKPNALLENIVYDENTGEIDYSDVSKTKNTRVSYPIEHIENIVRPKSIGDHPKKIIFLSCDAFGVLPPVARLTKEQAMYYFLSGYTAKVAGTERGINEPVATFSPCFGGPFLTLHPTAYAKLLGQKIEKFNTPVYLVNTGWVGGAYGEGNRMDLPQTRSIIHAILDSSLEEEDYIDDPIFKFLIPLKVNQVDSNILNPINAWKDKDKYEQDARKLADMFIANFEQYKTEDHQYDFSEYGPCQKGYEKRETHPHKIYQ